MFLLKVFLTFFKISALTLGGGYAMVPVIQKNLENKGWMTTEDFYNLLTLAQALPGPIAFNTSWMVGKRIAGMPGAVLAPVAVLLPPFFAIVAASSIIMSFGDNAYVQGFLKGAYGALIGMIAGLVFKLYKNQTWNIYRIVLICASIAVVIFKGDLIIPLFVFIIICDYVREIRRGDCR